MTKLEKEDWWRWVRRKATELSTWVLRSRTLRPKAFTSEKYFIIRVGLLMTGPGGVVGTDSGMKLTTEARIGSTGASSPGGT